MGARMHDARHLAASKIAAVVLALALAVSTLAPSLTIETLHDHDCVGNGCAICMVLGMAQSMLRTCAAPVDGLAQTGIATLWACACIVGVVLVCMAETPVTNKVKLLI